MAENNSSAPLLPCPFCGGAAVVQKESPADNSGGYFVDCKSCRASTNLRYACGDNQVPLLMERCNARAPQAVEAQAAPAGSEAKALAALRYYNSECTGQEPSLSVFQQMVDEALAAAPAAVQAVPEQWTDLARRCLIAMEMAVEWGKTREGRPPAQTCLFEIEDLRAMLAAPQAQPADALDAETIKKAARYDWIREQGMLSDGSRHPHSWRCVALLADMGGERADEAIDAAMAAAQEGGNAAKEA